MSALTSCARILKAYVYDPARGFTDLEDGCRPCIDCVCAMHRDSRLVCVVYADKSKNQGKCVCCDLANTKCGGLPRELWGAAQWYWNTVCDFYSRDPHNPVNAANALAPIECHRVVKAMNECGTAWNALAGWVTDPMGKVDSAQMALYQLQEMQAQREVQSLTLRRMAGLITDPRELSDRLDAAQPPYSRDDTKVQALERALIRLRDCVSKPIRGEKPRPAMRNEFSAAWVAALAANEHEQAPLCAVKYAGAPPIPRGSKRAADSDDDDDGTAPTTVLPRRPAKKRAVPPRRQPRNPSGSNP